MTFKAPKTGYPGLKSSSDHLSDHLPDHLRFLHASHRGDAPHRVSKVICFMQKKRERETRDSGAPQRSAGKSLETDPLDTLDHLSPAVQAQKRRVARRAEQRLKRRAAKVAAWWRSHPAQPPPAYFYPADLSRELGLPVSCIGPVVRSLGWHQIQRRMGGKARIVWVPPCSHITKRLQGRPPLQSCP